jgi:hypothetical protein
MGVVRLEKVCHYTGFSSLFSSLQCVSSHPNRRQPGQNLGTQTPAGCSIVHPVRHPRKQQLFPRAESVIDLTEAGENWFCVIGSCISGG